MQVLSPIVVDHLTIPLRYNLTLNIATIYLSLNFIIV
jgi:hypothetical protein